MSAPRGWQFSMRGLLLGVGAAALLFTVQRIFGAAGTLLVVWVATIVGAHMLANAWGTRLPPARPRTIVAVPASLANVSASGLSRRVLFSRRWGAISGACAALGACAAIAALLLSGWNIGLAGLLLGGLSAAVIGGWAGFLAVSFIDVARAAWKEATDPPPRDA